MRLILLVFLVLAVPARAAAPCGTPEGVCSVEGGSYRLVLPEGDGPHPALLYLHGWGASAAAALRDRERLETVLARGYALILPQGVARAGRTQRDWAIRDRGVHPRDDIAFFEAVLGDAAARGVDRARVLLAGFSRGGSMVWDVACHAPALVRAYAPISGAFWEPLPERCAGPVEIFHVHGWTDRVVPLEGRSFRDGAIVQGDVFASLRRMRGHLGCDARQPDRSSLGEGGLWWRHWESCRAGRIDLLIHPGGHAAPEGWTAMALDWFEARLAGEAGRADANAACAAAC